MCSLVPAAIRSCRVPLFNSKTLLMGSNMQCLAVFQGDITKALEPLDLSPLKTGFHDQYLIDKYMGNEMIKRACSLEFADGQEKMAYRLYDITRKVQIHPKDLDSLEVRIAKWTIRIRNQIQHCTRCKRDIRSRVQLKERIDKRRKLLKKLRKEDYRKFKWLLEFLKIKYIPHPDYYRKLSKRKRARLEIVKQALAIRREKINTVKERVDAEKAQFQKYKEEVLANVERQLKELEIEQTKLPRKPSVKT
ncbi:28S ribosomal protein S15, mitochondrial isoform X2 [Lingula anatina]|uniref:Small ribosomal subunit protein uS15m n=1 Tax=Lingula anatina TaxID=7574 RepID=A0A1S3IU00_LINAN|nr:28S ribosomal protein S15, mitochondrial isoform X2 [Lingula anatina]|eukprot:XP_013401411.1 28S ribosomal protein S15, mitochondrial isoform X2 [Lingula anatina]